MKASFKIAVLLITVLCISGFDALADSDDYYSRGAMSDAVTVDVEGADDQMAKVGPNPQREYCVYYWNKYYEENKIDISVSSDGKYDEVVIFRCPECSLEEHYVEPFLNSRVNGKTGADRIKECGFLSARFEGTKGIQEVERLLLTNVEMNGDRSREGQGKINVDPVSRLNESPYGSLAPVDEAEPFESLDSVSETAGEASTDPSYTPPSEEPGYQKPLGVREAEGQPIGE